MNKKKKAFSWKKSAVEWTVIGSVAALLYFTGWYTEVVGTLQRGILWTGIFDADTSNISTTEGPALSTADFTFAMSTPEGETVSLSRFRGEVIFLNVWASWCPPCVAEMPTIQTLKNNLAERENIRFILLSLDENPRKAIGFMERKEFNMPYYFPASSIPNKFRSPYLPTTYVISKEGQIIYKKEGIADYSSPNFAMWLLELANS